jgi:hypothetical protein
MRPLGCPEASGSNYYYTLRKIPEECWSTSRRKPEITRSAFFGAEILPGMEFPALTFSLQFVDGFTGSYLVYLNGHILSVSLCKLTISFSIHFDPGSGGSLLMWNDGIHLQYTRCHYGDDQNLFLNLQDFLVDSASINCFQRDNMSSVAVCQTVKVFVI